MNPERVNPEREEHRRRWHDDLAAYSLDALDLRESALLERHLEDCADCTEWMRWLSPAVDMLPAAVAQQEPPPELRARLLEVVEREAAEEAASSRTAVVSQRRRISMPLFGSFALRPALAGFGICLLLVAGVAGYELREGTSTRVDTYSAVPTGGSIASGTLVVEGDEGSLQVANLPATKDADVYQAWVQHKGHDGGIVPSTVFDEGTGEVEIPAGLEGAAQVMVTREPAGGSKKPTEGALLIAELQ